MKNMKIKERFKNFTKNDIVTLAGLGIAVLLGLYFSIGMSVSVAQGKTLFGDSSNHENVMETVVSTSDYVVLSLFWVLTVLVIALFVYYLFFRREEEKKTVKKEIVNGKTVIVKEEKDESK